MGNFGCFRGILSTSCSGDDRQSHSRHSGHPEPRPRPGDPRSRRRLVQSRCRCGSSPISSASTGAASSAWPTRCASAGFWRIRRTARITSSAPPPGGCPAATGARCSERSFTTILQELTTTLGETSHFAVREGVEVFFIDHQIADRPDGLRRRPDGRIRAAALHGARQGVARRLRCGRPHQPARTALRCTSIRAGQ